MLKTTVINPIMTKKSRWNESKPTEYSATITNSGKGKVSIEVIRAKGKYREEIGRSFEIGDLAEYDSYNLSCTGKIVKITAKTVTIMPRFESRLKRLDLHKFAWRNYDFDAAETARSNSEISMTL